MTRKNGVKPMLKMLIVEDEKWEREGLLDFLDWRSFGLEVADMAVDGIEGLEKAETIRPDIIITDIKMPGMDGISMSKKIKAAMPQVKIIILTGYDDFKLAREAISFKADAYILKPLEETEFIPVLQKVIEECRNEKAKSAREDLINQQLAENLSLAKAEFLNDLLEGRESGRSIGPDEFLMKLAGFGINPLNSNEFTIMIIQITDAAETRLIGTDMVLSVAERILSKHLLFLLPFSKEGKFVCCLSNPSGEEALFRPLIAELFQAIHNGTDLHTVVGVGEPAASLTEISHSYTQAGLAVEFGIFWSSQDIIYFSEIDSLQRKFATHISEYIIQSSQFSKQLIAAVRLGNEERCFELLREMFQFIRENQGAGRDFIGNFLQSVIHELTLFLCTINKSFGSSRLNKQSQELQLSGSTSLQSLETGITEFIKNSLALINTKKSNPEEQIVQKVIQLIEERYMTDLGLQIIAREVFLSPNYLGNIFKKFTGKTFNDYLCERRMEKAKELLQSPNNKVGWVAAAVGIPNTSYFCTIFKQAFGMAPGEYQETFLRNL